MVLAFSALHTNYYCCCTTRTVLLYTSALLCLLFIKGIRWASESELIMLSSLGAVRRTEATRVAYFNVLVRLVTVVLLLHCCYASFATNININSIPGVYVPFVLVRTTINTTIILTTVGNNSTVVQ